MIMLRLVSLAAAVLVAHLRSSTALSLSAGSGTTTTTAQRNDVNSSGGVSHDSCPASPRPALLSNVGGLRAPETLFERLHVKSLIFTDIVASFIPFGFAFDRLLRVAFLNKVFKPNRGSDALLFLNLLWYWQLLEKFLVKVCLRNFAEDQPVRGGVDSSSEEETEEDVAAQQEYIPEGYIRYKPEWEELTPKDFLNGKFDFESQPEDEPLQIRMGAVGFGAGSALPWVPKNIKAHFFVDIPNIFIKTTGKRGRLTIGLGVPGDCSSGSCNTFATCPDPILSSFAAAASYMQPRRLTEAHKQLFLKMILARRPKGAARVHFANRQPLGYSLPGRTQFSTLPAYFALALPRWLGGEVASKLFGALVVSGSSGAPRFGLNCYAFAKLFAECPEVCKKMPVAANSRSFHDIVEWGRLAEERLALYSKILEESGPEQALTALQDLVDADEEAYDIEATRTKKRRSDADEEATRTKKRRERRDALRAQYVRQRKRVTARRLRRQQGARTSQALRSSAQIGSFLRLKFIDRRTKLPHPFLSPANQLRFSANMLRVFRILFESKFTPLVQAAMFLVALYCSDGR